jgi:putative nucleotidyltransferase with HDIG domain
MFESMSSGVAVYTAIDDGADFLVAEFNPAAERITRTSRVDVVGSSVCKAFPGVKALGLYGVIERVWRTGIPEALPAARYEDERLGLWVENFVYKLPSGEIFAMFDDVTEKQQTFQELRAAYDQLRYVQSGTLHALGAMTEFRDPYTAGHQQRVARVAVSIARQMGLSEARLEGLRAAATVHDIGKIGVPIEILSSPALLSPLQLEIVRQHATSGYEILKTIKFDWPVAEIVRQHHERIDGSGYPQGLRGEQIMLEARILAVADMLEAMVSHRPYRPALGMETALDELRRNRGVLYDSAVVDALMQIDAALVLESDPTLQDPLMWQHPALFAALD